ncbi:MAG: NAD/NADP octopine/nopaline dehydrogenase family protein [Armatimonadetes bacterium]|nr:NAD/NADP octopine/nopaline dehydrogenase family protein [Armatimonadota bacterium]
MAKNARFAILGAGNGGLSMAGDLVLHGFEVSGLYDRFQEAVAPVQQRGGIEMVGGWREGFAPIANATTDMAKAVAGAKIVVVVVPTFAHEWIATQLAPLLEDGQIVLLTPGYPFGTLLFRRTLQANGLKATVDLAETNLILYATRIVGPATVGIKQIKNILYFSALPATRAPDLLDVLRSAIPQLEPLANVLEVGFNCTNPLSHAPAVLLNVSRMEQDTGTQHFDFHQWITPGVARVKAAMDAERGAVVRAMGLHFIPAAEMSRRMYEGTELKLVPMVGPVLEGSKSVPPRYITEDVPMAMVAWSSMGQKLGVPTPSVDAMIHLANVMKETDFRAVGRTVEFAGLASKSMDEILNMVNRG